MRFREYTRGDLAAMFALDEVCFAEPFRFSERSMRHFAEARNALTVIGEEEATGAIAGFCIAHVESRVAYIVTLDVRPGFRRQGLARSMMARVEEKARAAGCGEMELHVSVENAAAVEFYEREGWERLARVKRFYGAGGDAWMYRKGLTCSLPVRSATAGFSTP